MFPIDRASFVIRLKKSLSLTTLIGFYQKNVLFVQNHKIESYNFSFLIHWYREIQWLMFKYWHNLTFLECVLVGHHTFFSHWDLFFQNFFNECYVCVYGQHCCVEFFSCNVFIWFCSQNSFGLIKWVEICCLLFYFLEDSVLSSYFFHKFFRRFLQGRHLGLEFHYFHGDSGYLSLSIWFIRYIAL